jgi:hypothetical protein
MSSSQQVLIEAPTKCLAGIEETTGRLDSLTREMQRDEAWGSLCDEVSCLDSIGDVMRLTLDVLEGKRGESRLG